jgi:hypothetical protein
VIIRVAVPRIPRIPRLTFRVLRGRIPRIPRIPRLMFRVLRGRVPELRIGVTQRLRGAREGFEQRLQFRESAGFRVGACAR